MKSKLSRSFAILFVVLISFSSLAIVNVKANPIINVYRDITPPEGTQAPIISIHTPKNDSTYPNNLTLNFDVTLPKTNNVTFLDRITKIYYKANWEKTEIELASGSLRRDFSIDLSGVKGGNLSVTIYAIGEAWVNTGEEYIERDGLVWSYNYYDRYEMTGSSTVSLIKDLVSPRITIRSPQNTNYSTPNVNVVCQFNEEILKASYCLDGNKNVTFVGDIILDALSTGEHELIIYAQDLAGNIGVSEKTLFTISDPFPTTIVVASIAMVVLFGLGIFYYRIKTKRKT